MSNGRMGEHEDTRQVCADASIVARGISKSFGKVKALDKVTLSIEPGTIFALLGPNGSGKTTLVRILTTLLRPDAGKAKVAGFDVIRETRQVRSVIGLAGQYPAIDENLTGRENLEMIGQLYHLGRKRSRQRAVRLLKEFDLAGAAGRQAKTYSGGMRRRLDLAATLVASPPILFLDEPTTGLDPRSRIGLWDVIEKQARDCKTVFLTTQYLEEADRLANKIAVLDNGRILREGTNQELKECCGGDTVIKVRITERDKMDAALAALQELGGEKLHGDPETGELTLPASEGTSVLPEIVRRLDTAQLQIAEVGLKPPTLDDVFLTLTGHTVEGGKPATPKKGRRPRRGRRQV
jgi:ABC-2 type transport system ATP-binding protein